MKDLKYLFAYTIPMVTAISIYAKGVFTFTTPIYAFIVIPVLELIIKERHDDFSEEELSSRKLDRFFDFLLYLNIPFVFVLLFSRPNISGMRMLRRRYWRSSSTASNPESRECSRSFYFCPPVLSLWCCSCW